MEMIERVARAMAKRNHPSASDRDIDDMWEGWSADAYAAIKAMREPTEAMVSSGGDCDWDGYEDPNMASAWRLMIDEALDPTVEIPLIDMSKEQG